MSATTQRRRWTRAEYERMAEAGGFGPEDRIELPDGEIWEMTPQGTRHAAVLVDLIAQKLEVYRTPEANRYASVDILDRSATIAPLHAPAATVAVSNLLPKPT